MTAQKIVTVALALDTVGIGTSDSKSVTFGWSEAMKQSCAVFLCLGLAGPLIATECETKYPSPELVSRTSDKLLYNLGPFDVQVEGVDSDAKRAGITEQQLLKDVELRLTKAGLNLDSDTREALFLNVNILESENTGQFAFSLVLQVVAKAIYSDAPQRQAFAAIWSKGALGLAGSEVAREAIRDAVADKVDQFLDDYLAANPRM